MNDDEAIALTPEQSSAVRGRGRPSNEDWWQALEDLIAKEMQKNGVDLRQALMKVLVGKALQGDIQAMREVFKVSGAYAPVEQRHEFAGSMIHIVIDDGDTIKPATLAIEVEHNSRVSYELQDESENSSQPRRVVEF
jgi:hypothetical protein